MKAAAGALVLAALSAAIVLPWGSAEAHSSSNSYLTVAVEGPALRVQWELALRDLDDAIGLDPDSAGAITWGQLKAKQTAIEAYARSRLILTGDGAPCPPGEAALLIDQHGDGAYAVLRFTADCPAPPARIGIRYSALFDIDPQHRGLVNVVAGGLSRAIVLSPAAPSADLEARIDAGQTFGQFFTNGIDHILGGWDHLLFVAMLLLPAMFRRGGAGWQPVGAFAPALRQTIAILTAFTLAHTLSLSCVVLGIIQIPARLIEGAIILTIVATAIDNIVPILGGTRWAVAFGFGLIHGLGFASALGPLSLPPLGLAIALLAFNLGVEAAQLSAAAVVLPVGYFLRGSRIYRQGAIPFFSGTAAILATLWFLGREFSIRMPVF